MQTEQKQQGRWTTLLPYKFPHADKFKLKDVLKIAIDRHNFHIKKNLASHGFKGVDADLILYNAVYNAYLDILTKSN